MEDLVKNGVLKEGQVDKEGTIIPPGKVRTTFSGVSFFIVFVIVMVIIVILLTGWAIF